MKALMFHIAEKYKDIHQKYSGIKTIFILIEKVVKYVAVILEKNVIDAMTFGVKNYIYLKTHNCSREEHLIACKNILEKEFSDLIDRYKELDSIQDRVSCVQLKNPTYIWTFWYQGWENVPEVVQLCASSVEKYAPIGCKIIRLNKNNLSEYVDIPEFLMKKYRKKQLSITHFSDIVRFAVLKKWGGLWVDATVLITSEINIQCEPIYSIQRKSLDVFYGPLTSFLIGGSRGNLLFSFMLDFLLEYNKKYHRLMDNHLINIAYAIAYDNLSITAKQINLIGDNNYKRQHLSRCINQAYDPGFFGELTATQIFHKLDWRLEYRERDETGIMTYYGFIKTLFCKD